MITNVKDNILTFYQQIVDDPNHRYRSWEHCYSYFQKRLSFRNEDDIDTASLHLAFYLASWGMYRGSSYLLWKDYKVHNQAVREMLDQKYSMLWRIDYETLDTRSPEVSLLFQLAKRLRQIYKEVITTVDGVPKAISPSDILISKILLGTIGCVPAYDRFVIGGIKFIRQFPARFGRNGYLGLVDFYRKNKEDFEAAQTAIANHGTVYPPMKLVDMYFWNLGYQLGVGPDDEVE